MPSTRRTYRLRIRDRADTYDAFVVTSEGVGGLNPFITAPPSGAGAEFNPLTGATTIGRYTVRVADEVGTVFGDPVVLDDPLDYPDADALTAAGYVHVGDGTVGWGVAVPDDGSVDTAAHGREPGSPTVGVVMSVAASDNFMQRTLSGLTPGASYTASVEAYGWGNLAGQEMGVFANGVCPTGSHYAGTFYTTPFTRVSVAFTADAAGEATVGFGLTLRTTGTQSLHGREWWFRDLRLMRVLDTTTSSGAALPPDSTTGRIVTSVLADAGGRLHALGRRAIVEESTDDGATYGRVIVAGYVNSIALESGITYAITVGETLRDEADAEVFAEVTPAFPDGSLLLGGPVFAPFPSAAAPVQADQGGWEVEVTDVTADQVGLHLVTAFDPADYAPPAWVFDRPAPARLRRQAAIARANTRAKGYFVAADTWTATDQYGSFPRLRARLTTGAFADSARVGEFVPLAARASVKQILGAVTVVRNKDWLVNGTPGAGVWLDWPAGGVDAQGRAVPAQPSVGATYYLHVYPVDVSERAPLHVTGHPVDVVTGLWAARGIPYSAAAAAAAKAALGAVTVALRLTGKEKLGAFLRDRLFAPFGLGQRVNAAGERELFASRHRPVDGDGAPAPAGTITLADCRDPLAAPIFAHEEQGAIAGVTYEWQAFATWAPDPDGGATEDARAFDGVSAGTYRVIGAPDPADAPLAGAAPVVYAVPGKLLAGDGAELANAADGTPGLQAWCDSHASALVSRYGRGPATSELAVFDTATYPVGAEVVVAVPVVPGTDDTLAPTSQRGLPVPAQVTGATRVPAGWDYKVLKTGVTVENGDTGTGTPDPAPADVAPTYTIAASVAAPTTVAVVTVTNAATVAEAGLLVRVEYAVGPSAPAGSGTDLGAQDVATDPTWDTPAVAAGSTVWARARAEGAGVVGAWGAWQSVTLAASQNGGPDAPAAPQLAYTIDGAGVVTVTATVDSRTTSVRFAASTSAMPASATVRAATADAAAPFTLASAMTLAEGATGFVAAYAYSTAGNESPLATLTITRGTAPADLSPSFVTLAASAALANERVLTAGAGITLTDGGPGGAATIAAMVTSAAPVGAPYVTLAADATLTAERVLTAGAGIAITDGGAGNAVTISATGGSTGGSTPPGGGGAFGAAGAQLVTLLAPPTGVSITAIPAALTAFNSGRNNLPAIDLTNVTHARLQGIVETAGAAGNLALQYRIGAGSWAYLNGADGPFLTLTTAGDLAGAIVAIAAGARAAGVSFRLVTVNGDGSSTPVVGNVYVELLNASTSPPPGELAGDTPSDAWPQLIDPLGGNEIVAAFYDKRVRVQYTSTGGLHATGWHDARGSTGFGPQIAETFTNSGPAYAVGGPVGGPSATAGGGTAAQLATPASALFDPALALSVVVGGTLMKRANTYSPSAILADDGVSAAATAAMGPIAQPYGANINTLVTAGLYRRAGGSFGVNNTDNFLSGAPWTDTGDAATAKKFVFGVGKSAGLSGATGVVIQPAKAPYTTFDAFLGQAMPTFPAGNWRLVLNSLSGLGNSGATMDFIIVLHKKITADDLAVIAAWGATYHGTVTI